MRKLLAYPLTLLYAITFLALLLFFHPIQWFCLRVLGYKAHKGSVSILNLMIMACTGLLGTRYTFKKETPIPEGCPVIIVSNHQSMYDIPPIIWYMRRYHPKFISKIELGKGIPSVSFNLRHGGSVLIDRKDPSQALPALQKFAEYIQETKRAAVIFPEGTRSRTGAPKKFATKGLKTLFKHIPDGIVVPLTINNSWKLLRYGKFPMGIGSHVTLTTHTPLKVSEHSIETLIEKTEAAITSSVRH